ncbi:hypothetical protein KEM54_005207 [Ascosphaera aggregata]|nr:hypothetical protein KEM54_005207 [Ascosphaera aggregata]
MIPPFRQLRSEGPILDNDKGNAPMVAEGNKASQTSWGEYSFRGRKPLSRSIAEGEAEASSHAPKRKVLKLRYTVGVARHPGAESIPGTSAPVLPTPADSQIGDNHDLYAHQLSSDSSLSTVLALPEPDGFEVESHCSRHSIECIPPLTSVELAQPRPPPSGSPPAWAETRSEICESIAWFRSSQAGLYHHDGFAYGLLIDRDSGDRSYMDDEIIVTRVGGGCSFKNGRLVQTKNHDATTKTLDPIKRSLEYKIPVGVIIGQKNTICPTEVPHRYNIADFFRITHIWFEKVDGKAAGRMRYEKCVLDEKSWWAAPASPLPSPLHERDSPEPADLEENCLHCNAPSLRTFTVGWMCLNIRCKKFYTIDGKDAESLPLVYDPRFLRMRTRFHNAPKPLYSLAPTTLLSLTAAGVDTATAKICWKGIICPICSRCICRRYWQGWKCESAGCGFYHFPGVKPIPLRLVIPDLEMGAAGHSVPLRLKKGEIHPKIEYLKEYRKDTFEIPDMGTITHFASNITINERKDGPNDMFRQIQEANIGLARHPLMMSMVPQMLTSHFAVNFGMPYKYVVNVDKKRFDEAPEVITNALGRLRWAAKQVAGEGAQLPNELLAVGYFEKMAMNYHDDGESSLGPTITTLSLGSKAEMTLRMKKSYWKPAQRSQFNHRKEVIIPGCGQYAKRSQLRQRFDANEISLQQYTNQRQKLLSSINSNECPVLVRMELNHGDMVVMHGSRLQTFYEHAVEPKGDIRFALTGRHIRPEAVPLEAQELDSYKLPNAVDYDGDEF